MPRPTSELIEWWRPTLRALDPLREVRLDEIEALYAERQDAPYQSLATDLRVSDHPTSVKVLLCGARGSGKSTELTRLARELDQSFCVVHTDMALGLPERASTLAVVTLLGVAALHAIEIWSHPDREALATLRDDRVNRGVGRLQAALDKFGAAVPVVAELVKGVAGIVTLFDPSAGAALTVAAPVLEGTGSILSAASKLRNDLARGPLEGRLADDKRDDAKAVVDTVNGILDDLRDLAGRRPLLLADGLDKRTGVEEVELALADEQLLSGLRTALVLTGPVNLRHDPRFRAVPGSFQLSLLYNVPVCARTSDGTAHVAPGGIRVLCDLYERRRNTAGIPHDLITADLVEQAAKMCSGIVRDFLWLLHTACKNALGDGLQRVGRHHLEAAIKKRRLEMEGYLDEGSIGILYRVLEKGVVPTEANADTLLFENFIACYPNGDVWFRPHEIIVEYIQAHPPDA